MKRQKKLVLKEKYQTILAILLLYSIVIIGIILLNARLGELGMIVK